MYIVVRYACLPEDEGRNFLIKGYKTKEEAKAWIQDQKGKYFRPSDYGILEEVRKGNDEVR